MATKTVLNHRFTSDIGLALGAAASVVVAAVAVEPAVGGWHAVSVAGGVFVPPWEPCTPNVTDCPGSSRTFQATLMAVTSAPFCRTSEFHAPVIVCPLGYDQRTVQPNAVLVPVLVTFTSAVNPFVQLAVVV